MHNIKWDRLYHVLFFIFLRNTRNFYDICFSLYDEKWVFWLLSSLKCPLHTDRDTNFIGHQKPFQLNYFFFFPIRGSWSHSHKEVSNLALIAWLQIFKIFLLFRVVTVPLWQGNDNLAWTACHKNVLFAIFKRKCHLTTKYVNFFGNYVV